MDLIHATIKKGNDIADLAKNCIQSNVVWTCPSDIVWVIKLELNPHNEIPAVIISEPIKNPSAYFILVLMSSACFLNEPAILARLASSMIS